MKHFKFAINNRIRYYFLLAVLAVLPAVLLSGVSVRAADGSYTYHFNYSVLVKNQGYVTSYHEVNLKSSYRCAYIIKKFNDVEDHNGNMVPVYGYREFVYDPSNKNYNFLIPADFHVINYRADGSVYNETTTTGNESFLNLNYFLDKYGDLWQDNMDDINCYNVTSFDTDVPLFTDYQSMYNYLLNGDISGQINFDINNPDNYDPDYSLTGFKAGSGINASWTGATERSYLTEVNVSEFVRAYIGYAAEDDFDNVDLVERYDDSFDLSDNAGYVSWLSIQKSDKLVRYVKFVPMYASNDGGFGAYFYGNPSVIWFNENGQIEKVENSFNYLLKHDFSKDKYTNDIPVPELMNVTHNSFTVSNIGNYYIDVIVESHLLGVKHEKYAGSWTVEPDTEWAYTTHYYNLTDASQVAIKSTDVNLSDLYNINNTNELILDFKKWSTEYPSHTSLPTYSFLRSGSAITTKYKMQHLYSDKSDLTDEEQLVRSEQAQTIYYVRYYDDKMRYGPWARYTYRDGAIIFGGFLSVGQLETDENGNLILDESGNPVIDAEINGRQDYVTGETDYNTSDIGIDITDINSFFNYITSVFTDISSSLSAFGNLIGACFQFLPKEVIGMITFGIVLMVFVGVIKAVKS